MMNRYASSSRMFSSIGLVLIVMLLSSFNLISSTNGVMLEDFNSTATSWITGDSPLFSARIESSFYIVENRSTVSIRTFMKEYPLDVSKDFSIEMNLAKIIPSSNVAYGIIWGYYNDDNYSQFVISPDKDFLISSRIRGENIGHRMWKTNDIIHADATFNRLKIEKTGDMVRYYINREAVGIVPFADLNIVGTSYGVALYGLCRIEVDQLKISGTFWTMNTVKDDGKRYIKVNLGPNINSGDSELAPIITADGNYLYFCRKISEEDFNIWYSVKSPATGTWGKAINIGAPLNNETVNAAISVSADNSSMLVMNLYANDGSPLGSGISITHKQSNGWTVPREVLIDENYNLNKYVSHCLSQDGDYLIISSERDDSAGELDLYVCFRIAENEYDVPLNLGRTINTHTMDGTPFLASDNKTLYFASMGHAGYGNADIFVSRRLDETWTNWSEPENLGPDINSDGFDAYFTIPASGDTAYLVTSQGSFGDTDIVQIRLPMRARPAPVVLVKGRVLDKNSLKPVAAEIRYFELTNNREIGKATSDPNTGNYNIILQAGRAYSFRAEKSSFYAINENLDVSTLTQYREIERDLKLAPIAVGQTIQLNNIFFDHDKSVLKSESMAELDRLVAFLKKEGRMSIEVSGHTDNTGSEKYNYGLSKERASAVVDYIVSKGISRERLKSKGYGSQRALASNTTEEGCALNRRVEFTILSETQGGRRVKGNDSVNE